MLASCGNDDPVPGGAVTVGRVTAGGEAAAGTVSYTFDLPTHLPAGPTRFSLANAGDEPHHAQVFRLDPDATFEDREQALTTGDSQAPLQVGTFAGGTALVDPGETSTADAVIDLAPGRYTLVCFVEGPDGLPHLAHGMLRPFAVTDERDDDGAVPRGRCRRRWLTTASSCRPRWRTTRSSTSPTTVRRSPTR